MSPGQARPGSEQMEDKPSSFQRNKTTERGAAGGGEKETERGRGENQETN